MEVSNRGIALIQRFEGCRLEAYRDSAGVWTIGYGSIVNVRPGDVITQTQAVELLAADVDRHADGVRRCVDVDLNQSEFNALVSFAFNVGVGALSRSTLLRKLNAGESRQAVASEFLRWTYAGGKELRGLVRRREAERAVFLEPEPPAHWADAVDTGERGEYA